MLNFNNIDDMLCIIYKSCLTQKIAIYELLISKPYNFVDVKSKTGMELQKRIQIIINKWKVNVDLNGGAAYLNRWACALELDSLPVWSICGILSVGEEL